MSGLSVKRKKRWDVESVGMTELIIRGLRIWCLWLVRQLWRELRRWRGSASSGLDLRIVASFNSSADSSVAQKQLFLLYQLICCYSSRTWRRIIFYDCSSSPLFNHVLFFNPRIVALHSGGGELYEEIISRILSGQELRQYGL